MDISTDFTFYCTKESGALLEAKERVASPNPEKTSFQVKQRRPLTHWSSGISHKPLYHLVGKNWPFHNPGYYYLLLNWGSLGARSSLLVGVKSLCTEWKDSEPSIHCDL